MPQVQFTSNLQRHLACPSLQVRAATVGEALEAVFEENPKLRGYLTDDQGRLRRHVKLFVNDAVLRDRNDLSEPLAECDTLFVFQALSGG
jgi:molybdopterin synthase sulfur carrier subunit